MITKLIQTGSYDFDEPCASVLSATTHSIKVAGFAKAAGVEQLFPFLSDFTPPANHTVIHVIAVGDAERWGPNRNCDSFSRADNKANHRTFCDLGHVFRNHKNHSPSLKIGDVLASAHNDKMDRIELALALDNDKCRDEIERIHNGDDAGVSMGTKQAFDVCSFCGHRAKTAADHCTHVRNHLGEVADDGTKIAMLNPNPQYFDISMVWKPAERVAYTLRKLASASGVLGGHDLAREFGFDASTEKLATMQRLASILKEQPVAVRPLPKNLEALPKTLLKQAAGRHGTSALLGYLHKKGFMLSPSDFGELLLDTDGQKVAAACEEFERPLPTLESDELPDCLMGDDIKGTQLEKDVPEGVEQMLTSALSMEQGPARDRVVSISLEGQPVVKIGNYVDIAELQGLADLYAHYKLAFAAVNQGNGGRVVNAARTFLLP